MTILGNVSYSLDYIPIKGKNVKTLFYLCVISTLFAGCASSGTTSKAGATPSDVDFNSQAIQTKRALEAQQEVLLNADT